MLRTAVDERRLGILGPLTDRLLRAAAGAYPGGPQPGDGAYERAGRQLAEEGLLTPVRSRRTAPGGSSVLGSDVPGAVAGRVAAWLRGQVSRRRSQRAR